MITLNYAKKINDKYVMNFYADTEDDLQNFDASKEFLFYGVPAEGSVVTITSNEQDAGNYYLNGEGNFVKIPTSGDEPGDDPVYSLSFSDFTFEEDKPNAIKSNVNDFSLNQDDQWVVSITGFAGITNENLHLEYESDPKEGDMFAGNVGTDLTLGNVEFELSEDKGDGFIWIGFDNDITEEQFNTLFTNLSVKLYKQ